VRRAGPGKCVIDINRSCCAFSNSFLLAPNTSIPPLRFRRDTSFELFARVITRNKYLTVLLFHLIFLSFALAVPTANTAANTTANGQPAERYELCKSTEEIQALQQQYNLTLVSSVPTKAAYISLGSSSVSYLRGFRVAPMSLSHRLSHARGTKHFVLHLLDTFLLGISWVASFARIEADKAGGGYRCWADLISFSFSSHGGRGM
jgi:hypothetical protein